MVRGRWSGEEVPSKSMRYSQPDGRADGQTDRRIKTAIGKVKNRTKLDNVL